MPTNYIVGSETLSEEKQQDMIGRAKAHIGQICAVVKEKKSQEVEMGGFFSFVCHAWIFALMILFYGSISRDCCINRDHL